MSELCNPASLSSVCQECSQEVTARLTGLNQIHRASIVPPGCDPNDWRLHWPRTCRTDHVCLEARVLQVVIPIIINYHISAAHRCTQLFHRPGNPYIVRKWASRWVTTNAKYQSKPLTTLPVIYQLVRGRTHQGAWTFCPFPFSKIKHYDTSWKFNKIPQEPDMVCSLGFHMCRYPYAQ